MAGRGEELNTRLTADDQASAVVDKVAGKMADLEDRDHEVDVTGDTSDVDGELTALDRRLRGLTDSEKRIVLELAAKDAQRDVDKLNRDLARAEKYDDTTIDMIVNAKGDAERKLDTIQAEIRDIDGASPTVRPEVDSSELDAFVGKLGDLGGFGGAVAGAAGPAAAVAATLGLAVNSVRDIGTEVQTIATVLGTSAEEASRLRAVFADTGVEANDLQDIALQTTGALADNADLASRIGISIADAQNPAEALKAAINGWDFLSATERSQLFGEEGVRQIGQLIARGESLDDLLAGVESRRIMSEEDIANARRLQEIVADFKGELEGLALTIGGPLATAIADLDSIVAGIPGRGDGFGIGAAISDSIRAGLSGNAGGPSLGDLIKEQLTGGGVTDAGKDLLESVINEAAAGEVAEKLIDPDKIGQAAREAGFRAGVGLNEGLALAADFGEFGGELGGIVSGIDDLGAGFDGVREAADEAGRSVEEVGSAAEERYGGVNDEMLGAALAAEEWGRRTAEAAGVAVGAIGGVEAKISGVLGRISEQSSVDDLADQWDAVTEALKGVFEAQEDSSLDAEKAQRDYRDELAKLATDLDRFAEQVGDIPDDKLVRIYTAIEEGDYAAVQAQLDALFADREINLSVRSGSQIARGEDGGLTFIPTRQPAPAPTLTPVAGNTTINYQLAVTPSLSYQSARAYERENGDLAR
jgi:hypothetical protein